MKYQSLDRKILILEIASFCYLVFIMLYKYIYDFIPNIINTIIGVFTNLLTIPITLLVIPFGLGYAFYQIIFKKNKSKLVIYTLVISTISTLAMITATVLDQ